jgi:hypothetical protein
MSAVEGGQIQLSRDGKVFRTLSTIQMKLFGKILIPSRTQSKFSRHLEILYKDHFQDIQQRLFERSLIAPDHTFNVVGRSHVLDGTNSSARTKRRLIANITMHNENGYCLQMAIS